MEVFHILDPDLKNITIYFSAENVPEVPKVCDPAQYQCEDESCIDQSLVCNGQYDCADGSDEYSCGEFSLWLTDLVYFY